MNTHKNETIICILSDIRGTNIPMDFITDNYGRPSVEHCKAWHIDLEDAEILLDPRGESYWDTWDDIIRSAYYIAKDDSALKDGRWTLYQEGDLFAVHEGHEFDDE